MKKHNTIVIMGRSGSGKGTQLELLKEYLLQNYPDTPLVSFESGKAFRDFIEHDGYTNVLMRSFIGQGTLAPDFITEWLFADALIKGITEKHEQLIIDGFPRTVPQAQTLVSAMEYYQRTEVTILNIDVSEEEVRKRMLARGRSDDQDIEAIDRRIRWYTENVVPTIEFLRSQPGYHVIDIKGEGDVQEIHLSIINGLSLNQSN